MADRWAEVRVIDGRIAALIVELDRLMLRPWRWRRRREVRHELRELFADVHAAIDKAAAESPRRSRNAFGRGATIRYEP